MQAAGLNTYVYGPKDDLKHRADWRSEYTAGELDELCEVVALCRQRGIRFVYALGPGLDIGYTAPEDREALRRRWSQLMTLGVSDFALLFDDIPDSLSEADRNAYGSFAASQAAVTNDLFAWLREQASDAVLLFCPTPYCSRMDLEGLGGAGYLETLGEELHPAIQIFWTGPEIISKALTEEHLSELRTRLRRAPLIWENFHANDYDLRRLYTGPLEDRPSDPHAHLAGVLLNPNCEFEANFVPIHSLGRYAQEGPEYDPDAAFESGLAAWLGEFGGVGEVWTLEELRLLASVYYTPFRHGPVAEQLYDTIAAMLRLPPAEWGDRYDQFQAWRQQVHTVSVKLTELHNRDLFYTFNRQWWEIREEMDLFNRYFTHRQSGGGEGAMPRSPEHLVGTYRGSLIAQLQELLVMGEDGSFRTR